VILQSSSKKRRLDTHANVCGSLLVARTINDSAGNSRILPNPSSNPSLPFGSHRNLLSPRLHRKNPLLLIFPLPSLRILVHPTQREQSRIHLSLRLIQLSISRSRSRLYLLLSMHSLHRPLLFRKHLNPTRRVGLLMLVPQVFKYLLFEQTLLPAPFSLARRFRKMWFQCPLHHA
jgi:hypothetical protein